MSRIQLCLKCSIHPVHCRAAAAAKSLQLCPTLCDSIDGSPPGSPVPDILQARTLEWVAISFSNAWTWKVKMKSLSRVRLLGTTYTAAYQAPQSMRFTRQEYWGGLPLPSHCRAVLIYWLLLSLEKKAHGDLEGPENQYASFPQTCLKVLCVK